MSMILMILENDFMKIIMDMDNPVPWYSLMMIAMAMVFVNVCDTNFLLDKKNSIEKISPFKKKFL